MIKTSLVMLLSTATALQWPKKLPKTMVLTLDRDVHQPMVNSSNVAHDDLEPRQADADDSAVAAPAASARADVPLGRRMLDDLAFYMSPKAPNRDQLRYVAEQHAAPEARVVSCDRPTATSLVPLILTDPRLFALATSTTFLHPKPDQVAQEETDASTTHRRSSSTRL